MSLLCGLGKGPLLHELVTPSGDRPFEAKAAKPPDQFAPGDRVRHRSRGSGWQADPADSRDGILVADLQHEPLFENLLEHRAAVVRSGFVRPHSGQPRDLAKTGAVLDGLVLSPLHRLPDITSKHRLNDTRNPPSTPNLRRSQPLDTMELIPHGGCSSAGRALDCGSSGRGFEPHHPPHAAARRLRAPSGCCLLLVWASKSWLSFFAPAFAWRSNTKWVAPSGTACTATSA